MKVSDEYMPTDIQFKYELRKQLTELQRKLELLENEEYDKLEFAYSMIILAQFKSLVRS